MVRKFSRSVNLLRHRALSPVLLIVGGLLLSLPSVAAFGDDDANLTLSTPASAGALKRKQGYALLQLDVSGTAPSFELVLLQRRTDTVPDANAKPVRYGKRLEFDLTDRAQGIHLLRLPAGWYQVTRVDAPYYNLPFRVTTQGQPEWRFVVHENKTSYVGELVIAKERRRDSVFVALRNRIATALPEIDEQLAHILPTAPLVMGRGLRDDFLTDWRNAGDAP